MLKLFKPYGQPDIEVALVGKVMEVIGLSHTEQAAREEELFEKLSQADVLMGDVDLLVTDDILRYGSKLRAVVCRSIGVDFVDVKAATDRGILVANSPLFCVTAVAEYAMTLIFAAAHQLPRAMKALEKGEWEEREGLRGIELAGKTLGLMGYGRIGRELSRMAKGVGMRVVAYDPFVKEADVPMLPLRELMEQSDVLSIHSPLTPDTRGLLGAEQLNWMKPGAILVNVSRGGIVNEMALLKALESGRLMAAALDVLADEPPDENNCLYHAKLDNLILTPHVAWNTTQAHMRNQEMFYEQIASIAKGVLPQGVVNPQIAQLWQTRWQCQ